MTCRELREYLFAFLDNELDAPLSMELQRHLERCCECAREAEIERTIRRQLGSALTVGGNEHPFDERTLRQTIERITSPGRFGAGFGRRSVLAAAVAAVIVVVPILWLAVRGRGTSHFGARFSDLVVKDFVHFLEKGRPLQIASSDRELVSSWLRERTRLALVLPVSMDPMFRLTGGRKCTIGGRPAAFAVYETRGVPAALTVVGGGAGELDGMERVQHDGRTHWVDRRNGHTIVACTREKLVYAAVSSLPEEELLCLMAFDIPHGRRP